MAQAIGSPTWNIGQQQAGKAPSNSERAKAVAALIETASMGFAQTVQTGTEDEIVAVLSYIRAAQVMAYATLKAAGHDVNAMFLKARGLVDAALAGQGGHGDK